MDPWCCSDITFQRMEGLIHHGLLRTQTSAEEWLLPGNEDSLSPPDGYVVSFAHFHEHGLATPPTNSFGGCCTSTRLSCDISIPMGSSAWQRSSCCAKDS